MELTEQQQRRLVVVRSYHEYVRALQMARLNQDSAEVRDTRRALGRAIEAGCASDPHLLEDFKRAFAARQLD